MDCGSNALAKRSVLALAGAASSIANSSSANIGTIVKARIRRSRERRQAQPAALFYHSPRTRESLTGPPSPANFKGSPGGPPDAWPDDGPAAAHIRPDPVRGPPPRRHRNRLENRRG